LALRLYNSYGRTLLPFKPQRNKEVRMYTCGPTVWDYAHVGNFRTFLFEDLLRRFLEFKGFRVTQVKNITDVEDRIIRGMKEKGLSRKELTTFFEEAFMQDLDTLRIERAEFYPRATEHIPEMVKLVKTLLKKGFAYRGDDASIYYDISRFKRYGKLSGIKPKELKAGARVSQDHYEKAEARDFALWKAWDEDDGEVYWETELGKGRPGWHVECSAMSMKYLGESFDIHTGGMDLRFPHHENEIAQSEAATGKKLARFWLHSEFLSVSGKEMHKSSGNIVKLRDLLKEGWDPLTVRLFLISARYRDPINLTQKALEQAQAERDRLEQFVSRLRQQGRASSRHVGLANQLLKGFERSMDADLNTPRAFAVLFSFLKRVNKLMDGDEVGTKEAEEILRALKRINGILGIISFQEEGELSEELTALVKKRDEARSMKDFAKADEIRSQLSERGITLEDTPRGTVWRREPSPTRARVKDKDMEAQDL